MSAWFKTVFSEDNGNGSWSRMNGALTWLGAMALVWYSMLSGRELPSSAQVVLLSLLAAASGGYAVNRFTTKPEGPKEEP